MADLKLPAWLFIVGTILFIAAAFNPSAAVFAQSDPANKLEIIQNQRTLWSLSQGLFGAGATVTAVGVLVLAGRWMSTSAGVPLLVGGLAMVVGALLWDVHVYQRAVSPTAFVNGELPGWLFTVYTLLTLFGLLILGLSYIQVGQPGWLGYGTVAATLALFVVYLLFKDIPPFVYYLITFIGAVVLLL